MRALAPLALALTTLITTALAAPAAHAGAPAAGSYPAPAWPTTDVTLRGHVGVGGGHRGHHDHRHATTRRVWVPGAWVHHTERVWVPGHTERVWQEPRFSWRFDACGDRVKVRIGTGSWRTVHHPGHFEHRTVRTWQPGHWQVVGC